MAVDRDLAPGEWAVLALLCERPAHGWALARELGPSGELGPIWSLGRPLVYRSLAILERRGLIEPSGEERGSRGPNRTIFRPTELGAAAVRAWLAEPVERVRDSRSVLLLKLVFAERAGTDPRPVLRSQHRAAAAAIDELEARLATAGESDGILLRFRLESTRAVRRFVAGQLADLEPAAEAV